MRVALAGASGLVGSAIARELRDRGHQVATIGRGDACDVRFDLASSRELSIAPCDALVHAAGVTDEDFRAPDAAWAKARRGAAALADAALAAGARCLAYVSSAHVYGPLEGEIDEARSPDPRNDYARAHLETEQLFRDRAGRAGAALLIARPCAVFGPLAAPAAFARWSLIPFDFPRQAASGRIELKSTGAQRRNFASSIAIGKLLAGWLAGAPSSATLANAPGPDELSVYDFALLCARIAREEGRECRVDRPAAGPAPGPPLNYRSRLGLLPAAPSLEEHVRGLLRTFLEKGSP